MTEVAPQYQVAMFDATPVPPGLTDLQQVVYRVMHNHPHAHGAAELTWECWLEMGLDDMLPPSTKEIVRMFLVKRGSRMNPETFTRRQRELIDMGLLDVPQAELDRRQRMAHAGPPGR